MAPIACKRATSGGDVGAGGISRFVARSPRMSRACVAVLYAAMRAAGANLFECGKMESLSGFGPAGIP